jgi:hydrogenase/urease accessory protein HupE
VLSAAAVAARLYGLDAAGLRRAWGLAASQMSGLVRNFGTMTKPFHAGHAARCGVLSAWMAKNGFTSNEETFDAKGGALDTYRGDHPGEPIAGLVRRLGKPWEIIEPGIYVKRWPCCYSSHRTIGGLFNLIGQHRLRAEEINEVAIGFLPGGDVALVSRDPHTALEGKFSVEYAVAAALLDGRLVLETFTDGMVRRLEARELIRKVRRYAIADDKLYSGITGYNDLAVRTTRGSFEVRIDKVPGSPAWPMTESDRSAKFLDCAARVLGPAGAERLLDLARRTRSLPNIREVARAAVPAATIAAGLAAVAGPAHAHHVMDYATPATALEGLLSGLGHPVIGVDHLLFIAGAGVLAARFKRGYLLPLVFVAASIAAAGMRYLGVDAGMNELWIAGSLAVLGAVMLATRKPTGVVVAGLFLVAGALHGYALAESIVGAERTPLAAYLAGLAVIQSAIALAAWRVSAWLAEHRPRVPVQRLVGAAVGVAGLVFAGVAAFS